MTPIELPALLEAQVQAWHALMDLYDRLDRGWTLVGGQLVHLHCAERGAFPARPTSDVDTVVNVRSHPKMLETFTGILRDMGFTATITGEGLQHRWTRDLAQIDVLIPDGVGARSAALPTVSGAPTLEAPGTTQALNRTDAVDVTVAGRTGTVLRPNLVAALVGKAAARTKIIRDPAKDRHCDDFVVLAALIAARDFRQTELTKKDLQRLRGMLPICRQTPSAMSIEGAAAALDRLESRL